MPGRPPDRRRTFASGWLSDHDDEVMALIWHIRESNGEEGGHYEAEVIRGIDKIDVLMGEGVDELKLRLHAQYGGASASPPPEPLL